MVFEFKAHKPGAYKWFAFSLIMIIGLNALLVQSLHSWLFTWNQWMQQSVIMIVPWILFLFLPSVFIGLVIYHSLARRYRFRLTSSELQIEHINSKETTGSSAKIFPWPDVEEFRFSDFEDNEYFTLVFRDKKNNMIIHRETGDFEGFFNELKKYLPE